MLIMIMVTRNTFTPAMSYAMCCCRVRGSEISESRVMMMTAQWLHDGALHLQLIITQPQLHLQQ